MQQVLNEVSWAYFMTQYWQLILKSHLRFWKILNHGQFSSFRIKSIFFLIIFLQKNLNEFMWKTLEPSGYFPSWNAPSGADLSWQIVARSMGQMTFLPSVWCSKHFFFIIACKILCKNPLIDFFYNLTKN